MTTFSPAAQAVYDSFVCTPVECESRQALAAALRAAADQVLPDLPRPTDDGTRQADADIDYWEDCQQHKTNFLAIADELEGIAYGTYRCNLEAQ